MIKVKDGYAKLIGVSAQGAANQVLLSNGGNLTIGNAEGNIPLNNGTINTNLNADLLDGMHSINFARSYGGASVDTSLYGIGYDNSSQGSTNLAFSGGFISATQGSYGFQLIGSPNTYELCFRGLYNGVFSSWKQLAFIDSCVDSSKYLLTQYVDSESFYTTSYKAYIKWLDPNTASFKFTDGTYQFQSDKALKLTTSRNIFGQMFDGSADIGSNNIGSMRYLLFRNLTNDGHAGYVGRGSSSNNNLEFINYTSDGKIILATGNRSNDLELNASGNLGIGVSNPNYKLHIAGDIYLTKNVSAVTAGNTNPGNAAVEVREFGRAGTDTTIAPHTIMYSPRIGFHWGDRYWANIAFFDSQFHFINNSGSAYCNVKAATFIGNLNGKASTANMISHSTYYYNNNVMKNTTSSGSIFGETATENYLFPSFMEAHPKWSGYADVINFTGYCKWGGTQFATQYNAINPRVAIRKFNQSRSDWGDWTEFITEVNNYKVRDSGNSNEITFHYSTGGFSSTPSWLAAWNGYDITYVAPSVLNVKYATNSTYLYSCDSAYAYGSANPYYMKIRYNTNGDSRWYLSVYPETPKTVAVDYAYSSGNSDKLGGYAASDYLRNANAKIHRWTTTIKGSTWSRLYQGTPNTLHHSSIFSVTGSIGCVVFSHTFMVVSNHSTNAKVIQLFGGSYTQFQIRALVESQGNVLIDMNWVGNDCSQSSSTQSMSVRVDAFCLAGGISPTTSFVSDASIPSGYSNSCSYSTRSNCSVFMELYSHGNIYGSHFYETSDAKHKTNIQSILDSNNMPQLRQFDWKKSGQKGYGLIAQELEQQGYYELIDTDDQGEKTVNYSAALSLIVGKLQVKLQEIEKENKELRDEIDNLKNNKLWQS